jgi:hypothetical protein
MNIHVMIILLSVVAPVHKDLQLMETPQVVAPGSLAEDQASLKEWTTVCVQVREPV